MPKLVKYACTRCHREVGRSKLTVKKCVFLEMGAGARTKRARVLDWLCTECLELDPIWNVPEHDLEAKQETHA